MLQFTTWLTGEEKEASWMAARPFSLLLLLQSFLTVSRIVTTHIPVISQIRLMNN